MTNVAIAGLLLTVGVSLIHLTLGSLFVLLTRRQLRVQRDVSYTPKAAVILSLRGADAFLADSLRGLLRQDYPDYTVWIVVDCENDPAWQVAQQVVATEAATHVRIVPLHARKQTCSLKCSALAQAVRALDSSYQAVALMDADVVPHPTWLRELMAPLADERIGATTGNRWYLPGQQMWGSVARAAWNTGAITQMAVFRMAWGGTLGMRIGPLWEAGLPDLWERSFNDDIVVGRIIQKLGYKLEFVPSLLMVNREEIPFDACHRWVSRQLVHVRFYQRNWFLVALISHLSVILPPAGLVLAAICAALQNWPAAAAAVAMPICYFSTMTFLWWWIDRELRSRVFHGDVAQQALGRRLWYGTIAANIMYALALFSASLCRTVHWRGVTYRIRGPWNVQLVEYRPYQPAKAVDARISI